MEAPHTSSPPTMNGDHQTNGSPAGPAPESSSYPQPIAIIGFSCRLPGDVTTPDELWDLCSRARSGWSEIPASRFSGKAFHHPNPSKIGATNTIGGHFLTEDVANFDAAFFNVTAQEAISMDPQQRLMLECTFEALESAGMPKEKFAGKDVGVFAGGSFSDYELNNCRDTDTAPMYQATGCAAAMLSNRVSYHFDFLGPSFTVDTACSSSLTALHQAVNALRNGECGSAVVGGSHLNILPDYFIIMSLSQLFNDTGKSFPFDHRGNSGFGRGEGVGCVILKPLDQAIKDNDAIRAVITNSGVSQDGRTNGITAPNGEAQEKLMKRVYATAGLDRKECAFVEMHGTGTKVGDPIEANAVHNVFAEAATKRNPLYIGSVKSNIGHLEGASGIVSVIKTAMMLEKRLLLPNTNYEKTNPNIPLADWNMKVPTSIRPWPRGKKYISVNNFGFGGGNAHAILEKAPKTEKATLNAELSDGKDLQDLKWRLYPITANDQDALEIRAKDLGIYLEQRPEAFEKAMSRNLSYTLGQRRSHLAYKLAMPATSSDDLGVRLASTKIKGSRAVTEPRIGFVFTGQGAQWHAMGRELIEAYPIFRKSIEASDKCLRKLGAAFSLYEELHKTAEETQVNTAYISQPACTAIQLAVTDLLQSWGVCPTDCVGHSSGEISAAYAAGIMDSESAILLAYNRGEATKQLKATYPDVKGAMLAVGKGPDDIRPLIKKMKGYATVACVNAPSSVTVSGDDEAITELSKVLDAQGIFNRRLKVDVAYHSEHMSRVGVFYKSQIASFVPATKGRATFHSSLFGRIAQPSELDPQYWVNNLTSPVEFPKAVTSLVTPPEGSKSSVDVLVEIGPHAALEGPVKEILKTVGERGKKISYYGTLLRNKNACETILTMAANLFMRGAILDFENINFPDKSARQPNLLTDMPKYQWNHSTRYWHYARLANKHITKDFARNDILGSLAIYSNDLEPTWRNIVKVDDLPWLRHHKMQGLNVYPIAGYLAMAMEAAAQRAQMQHVTFDRFDIREVTSKRALILDEASDVETTITLRPYNEGTRSWSDVWDEFRICSWTNKGGWAEHCRGLIGVRSGSTSNGVDGQKLLENGQASIKKRAADITKNSTGKVDSKAMYETLSAVGAIYGESFQGLTESKADDEHAFADIVVPDTKSMLPKERESCSIIHPAFLDDFIQIVWPIFGAGRTGLNTLYMPSSISRISIARTVPTNAGDKLRVFGKGDPDAMNPKPTHFDIFATSLDNPNESVISFDDLIMTPINDADSAFSMEVRELCYKFQWESVKAMKEAEAKAAAEQAADKHGANGASNGANGHIGAEQSDTESTDVQMAHGMNVTIIHRGKEQAEIVSHLSTGVHRLTGSVPSAGTLSEIDPAGKVCIVLMELDKPFMDTLTEDTFLSIQKILNTAESVLWVVRGATQDATTPTASMIVGVARTVRSETMAKIVTLDLDSQNTSMDNTVDNISKILEDCWISDSKDMEFMERKGEIFVPRVVEDTEMNMFVHRETQDAEPHLQSWVQEGRRLKIAIEKPGALDTLHFVDDIPAPLDDLDVEIEVKATGMNFKDIVVAMGQVAQPYIGVECSGVISSVGKGVTSVKPGDRVMAMSLGAYSTYARCPATSVSVIPDAMQFETACTIPVVFCTAYQALINLAQLTEGESVLIHAAAGGVGQAAIQLCHMIGAEVYATVGSDDKKQFLMKEYGVPEDRIFYSRDTSFGPAVRRATDGKGVDVILNSLAGDVLRETFDCLAHFGRFIEIGKRDITQNTRLEMARFEYNATFSSIDLTKVAAERPKLMKSLLINVCDLLQKGTLKAVSPITTYRITDIESTFRKFQSGKSMGKLVIVGDATDKVKALPSKTSSQLLPADASYLIIGGTGGLGRSMAKWMASKGAKSIILVSRGGKMTSQLEKLTADLNAMGSKVTVKPCDVAEQKSVGQLLKDTKGLPPIRGIIHAAMVLRDTLFEKMNYEDYMTVIKSKVAGAWNLHHALSNQKLDFFVTLSSVAGIVGNRGQAAYAAANVFLDSFVQYRNANNMPATSIDLTAVSNVGYLADNQERSEEVSRNLGGETLDENEVLALLSAAIRGEMKTQCGNQCITGLKIAPGSASSMFWANDAKFSYLKDASESGFGDQAEGDASIPLPQALKATSSKDAAVQLLYHALVHKLSGVLMVPVEEMEPEQPIASYGLDSLVAIEVRNWIIREAEANLQVLELLTSTSLISLTETILSKSKLINFKETKAGEEKEEE